MTSLRLKLNTGAEIPPLGLGTWNAKPGEVESAIEYAIVDVGVRHIDGAARYGNESEVGEGIRRALATGKVKRSELFVTTKVWPSFHNRVELSLDESLAALGLDYVDLVLVHWPFGFNPNGNDPFKPTKEDGSIDLDPNFSFEKNWAQFEAVYAKGKAKAIGVSNFSVINLKKLLETAKIVPALNQIECHPLLPQTDVFDFCKEKGIVVEAWRPLGKSSELLLENEDILAIAKRHNVGAGSVLISWHLREGRSVIPKSSNHKRIAQNSTLVELDDEELKKIDNLHKTVGLKRFGAESFAKGLVHFPDWD